MILLLNDSLFDVALIVYGGVVFSLLVFFSRGGGVVFCFVVVLKFFVPFLVLQ